MATLNAAAKGRLRAAGVTPSAWARRWFDSPTWCGDACGCPDDRCRGHHHDVDAECGCLASLIEELPQPQVGRYLETP